MARLLGIVVLIVVLCVAAGALLGRAILRAHLAYTHASIGWHRAAFDGLRVTLTGPDPVLEADHAEVAYNLRDLAVGSARALGIAGVTADHPRITLVHYADGTWNAPIQQKNAKAPNVSIGPFVFDARIHDGSIYVRDERLPHSPVRELHFAGVQAVAHIDQRTRSTYRAEASLIDRDRSYPIYGRGYWDDRRGYEDNHWTSRALPLVPVAWFSLAMPQASVAGGSLDFVDAHYSGLLDRDGTVARHLTAHAYLNGLRIYLPSVKASLRNVHGDVFANDDGAVAPHLDASLAGLSIVVSGGVYQLAAPQVRFGVQAHGSASAIERLAPALAGKHLTGDFALSALAEGPVSLPLVIGNLGARRLTYGAIPLDALSALVTIQGKNADIIGASARYGPLAVNLRGETILGSTQPNAEGFVRVRGPLQAIPYAAAIPGKMDVDTLVVASGAGDAFDAGGLIGGAGQGESLSGTLRLARNGNGSIGPLVLERDDGSSLYALVTVDRKCGESVALVNADRLPLDTRRTAQLPGFKLAALPPLTATVSARMGADVRGRDVAALGDFNTRAAIAGGTLVAVGNFSSERSLNDMQAQAGIALTGARYRNGRVNATSALRLANGRLEIGGAMMSYGAALAMLDGSVAGLGTGKVHPQYDLRANMVGAPLALVAALAGRTLPYPEGGIDAAVRVTGAGTAPNVAGNIAIPEGSVNGLAFTDGSVDVSGTPQALRAQNGHVTVGSTKLQFDGAYNGRGASGNVRAPRANLADFNEYFITGDTLAGTGSVATSFSIGPTSLATQGSVAMRGVRVRRFNLGATSARWTTQGRMVSTQASISGPAGKLRIGGSIAVPSIDPMRDPLRRSDLNLTANAQAIDLREYLPLLGVNAPVTGTLSAEGAVRGRYPSLEATAHATVEKATVARLALGSATATVSTSNGRARIVAANVAAQHLSIEASGDAGLRAADPLNLTAHVTSDDVGAVYNAAMGKKLDVAGKLDSTFRLGGTLSAPALAGTLALDDARYAHFTIPHAGAQIVATRTAGMLRNGEVNFPRGRLLTSGTFPLSRASGPLRIAFTADAIDLGPFGALLPQGTKLGGTLNGSVTVAGTTENPLMNGDLRLAGGSFSAPYFQAGLSQMTTMVAFSGHQIAIPDASAKVGGGTIVGNGTADVPNLRTAMQSATLRFEARTNDAGFDIPAYFRGKVDADVIAARSAGSPINLGGEVAISHARIPVNALYNPNAPKSSTPFALPIAFNDLGIIVGQDVRVQSNIVDVGARGKMTIGGTLAQPQLAGAFDATGGTVDVYHDFRLVRGHVVFSPDRGLMPTVNAVATTSISNPPTDITLHITGTVPDLNLGLSSDPQYSRSQILGLLLGVQALGAVQGLPQTGGATQAFNAGTLAENEAEAVLRTQLTRGIFEPLQSSLGNALGFNNLQLNLNASGGFEAHATKGIAKHLNAVFGETYGPVSKQIIGVRATPNDALALQMTYYQQQGAIGLSQYNPTYLQALNTGTLNQTLNASTSSTGTNGYSFSVQRRYP